jgi:cobalt-zinc-cadmium efflux system protein
MSDLVSSVAALIAGAVVYVTGWVLIDPILSLVIAALILMSTLALLRDTLHVLMEGVPASVDLARLGATLATVPGVASVHDLHVWSITPGSMALSAHLEVNDLARWPETLIAARAALHDHYGIDHVTLQPESTAMRLPRTEVIRLWPRGWPPHR